MPKNLENPEVFATPPMVQVVEMTEDNPHGGMNYETPPDPHDKEECGDFAVRVPTLGV